MAPPKRESAAKHFRRSDLRAVARLATQATEGVTRIAEGVHDSVWRTMGVAGRAPQRTGGLTGLVYRSVGGVTRGVGWGIEQTLRRIEPLLGAGDDETNAIASPRRDALLSVLNGVMGDRLEADGSPFAIDMHWRIGGKTLDLQKPPAPTASGSKLLLMIHGLCMNDRHWSSIDDGRAHDHGRIVADTLGYQTLYLRYNSGRHVSKNGKSLADLLEQLLQQWPVPITELSVLAHSMGGLLIRSAIDQASKRGLGWPARLKHVVFLGTPHHGAPLERAGRGVELILASTRWSAPFVRLAGLRSAGITDLRHGNLLEQDWQADETSGHGRDTRQPMPLPPGIRFHTVAATTSARRSALADRLIGDGLVPLNSALGRHRQAAFCLAFAPESSWISYRTGHLALLSRPAISERILGWLGE